MTIEDLNSKLEQLRKDWENQPRRRFVIELQARAIKMAIKKKKEDTYINTTQTDQQLLKDIQETML